VYGDNMIDKYINYFNSFKVLDTEDKKEEIINHFKDLIELLYKINKYYDNNNEILPILDKYETDEEFLDLLFTYIITLKEENAKMIENIRG